MIDPTLRRLADGVLSPPFKGPDAPPWVLDALASGLAGVTLFGSNIAEGTDRLRSLTGALRGAAPDALISIDEEGGDVTRLWYSSGSPYPGNAALGTVDDVSLTHDVYLGIGGYLADLGINLDFAPCVDILRAPDNPVVGTRSFGTTADLVSRHGAAAVRGLQDAGVAACVKHFPGHGSTAIDTHELLASIADDWAEFDLPPFRAAIEAGTATIMPGHLRVPGLTGTLPASLSPEAIALIRSLGFDGVVVTDALEMRAVSDPYGIPGAAVLAMAAGVDLLCLGNDVSQEGYLATRDALAEAARDGSLPAGRLEEAAARVAGLRARPVGVGGLGLRAARRAVRLTGNRPNLTRPVVVEIEALFSAAEGNFHWGLGDWVPADSLIRVPRDADPSNVLKRTDGRDLIVVYRNAFRSPATIALVSAILAERPGAVPVEMGLPFWQPEAETFITTYGASRASSEAAAELLGLTPLT